MPTKADIHTPLNGLIMMLRQEGFDISTRTILDIQKVIANLDDDQIKDTASLKHLLGPLICRNKEEQDKFYKLFDQYEEQLRKEGFAKQPVIAAPTRKWLVTKIVGASGILGVLLFIYFAQRDKPRVPSLHIQEANNQTGQTHLVNEPVSLVAHLTDTSQGKQYFVDWRIEGHLYHNVRQIELSFPHAGRYNAKAILQNRRRNLNATAETTINISCEQPPGVNILQEDVVRAVPLDRSGNASSRETLYSAKLINPSKDSELYSYNWWINDSSVSKERSFSTGYSANRPYTVMVVVDCKGLHCSTDSLTNEITVAPNLRLRVQGTDKLSLRKTPNWANISLLFLFSIALPGALSAYVYRRKVKKITEYKSAKGKGPSAVAGEQKEKEYTGPYNIEFRSQQNLMHPDAELGRLAGILRQRHSTDVYNLNVRKTIKTTIKKGGFPSFQFTPRTEPVDFLFFIDKEYPSSHLLKLFFYLSDTLKKEQVNLTVYTYYKEPLLLNNDSLNHFLIPVEKIARLYPNTILFLFTNADSFFKPMDVHLKDWANEKFKSWNTKMIITPVSTDDWGSKELALYDAGFTVVPADINAHTVIFDEINEMIDKQKLKKEIVPNAYSSMLVNFNHWSDVEKYLEKSCKKNRNIYNLPDHFSYLRQWVCALAVYPQLNWDVTVAIGNALEEKYCKPGELVNYTNLLVLGRISWMQDGQLSDSVRLEMLSHLENEFELLARDVIIKLLTEIEDDVTQTSLIADEFKITKTTNSFLVRNHRGQISGTDDSDFVFMKELVHDRHLDWPLEVYLNNPSANSLLRERGNANTAATLKKYFDIQGGEQERKINKQKRVWQVIAAAIFLILASIGWMLLALRNRSTLASRPTKADRVFVMNRSDFLADAKNAQLSFYLDGKPIEERGGPGGRSISDSTVVLLNVPVQDSSRMANMAIYLGQRDAGLNSSIDLSYQTYRISLAGPSTNTSLTVYYNSPQVYDSIQWQLKKILYEFNIVASSQSFIDSSRIVYSRREQRDSIRSIAQRVQQELGINLNTTFNNTGTSEPPVLYLNLTGPAGGAERGTHRAKADSLLKIGKYSDAIREYVLAVQENPKDPLTFYNRGLCYENLKGYGQAIVDYTNAIRLNSGDALAHFRRGNVYYTLGDYNNAINDFNSVISINNKSAQSLITKSYYFRGHSKLNLDQTDAACQDFQQAMRLGDAAAAAAYYKTCKPENCSITYQSIAETRKLKSPLEVCKLNLSNQNLSAVPKEVFSFRNLKELDISHNRISNDQINSLVSRLPDCKITFLPQQSEQTSDTAFKRIMAVSFATPGNIPRPDTDQLSFLRAALANNRDAKLRLDAGYSNDLERKMADQNLGVLKNYFLNDKSVSQSQIEQRLHNIAPANQANQYQQQNNALERVQTTVTIYGLNIPSRSAAK